MVGDVVVDAGSWKFRWLEGLGGRSWLGLQVEELMEDKLSVFEFFFSLESLV